MREDIGNLLEEHILGMRDIVAVADKAVGFNFEGIIRYSRNKGQTWQQVSAGGVFGDGFGGGLKTVQIAPNGNDVYISSQISTQTISSFRKIIPSFSAVLSFLGPLNTLHPLDVAASIKN